MISIVENACLLHDLGNPPFGHFGEEAIKDWFKRRVTEEDKKWPKGITEDDLFDFLHFDGNPQGFRIATRMHCERDSSSLNLTAATLLSSIKYPHCEPPSDKPFGKKIGYFRSEKLRYKAICEKAEHVPGKRYFLVYLMEMADDCCYCLSDIADGIEKNVITIGQYAYEIDRICKEEGIPSKPLVGNLNGGSNFRFSVAIPITRRIIQEAAKHYADNLTEYVQGVADEVANSIDSDAYLRCLKKFSRRHIYKSLSIERLELSGYAIVSSLLDNFGRLLELPFDDFRRFVDEEKLFSERGFDREWRLYNRLSKRMANAYRKFLEEELVDEKSEWLARAHLIVDFIAGMTDDSARDLHQILTGTESNGSKSSW